ncbi:unannotated protein [freshwater metagenome]|uniref:Unannotated protein n=1 Tax=freshwater metagenome TaxID=449393 RepID=A0A6J7WAK4_9ZZZZ
MLFTALMIALTGSSIALRISAAETTIVLGRPVAKSRPRISASFSPASGYAEPIAILISSAVRSPKSSENSRLTQLIIDWSSSSPPTRIDSDVTIPPSEITATSVVPPPISTTIFPVGSWIGSPAPIAAAIGSSIM